MRGVNMVIVMGRLGNDPEMRYTRDGTAVANMSLAVNERWKDNAGQTQERVEWVKVVLWGKLAEVAKEYLNKGDACFIRGKLQSSSWDDKDGNKRYKTEVRADEIQLMGGKKDGDGGGDRGRARSSRDVEPPADHGYSDDDVPF
jgi:single-strand DNA-binding protein